MAVLDVARERVHVGSRLAVRTSVLAEALGLSAILALSAGLNLVALDGEGYGNTYYAAAVWSMLQNWQAFVFAAFDAPGFVTVDKPPVGLWLQALSARLLGFSGVALLLPQALAGVACVGVLYLLVRRGFGPLAGVIAALVLAITPISVVTDRNNTMDATLVLALLLAAWAVTIASERGSLGLLLVGAAGVGVGFNIKMLQAYPVLPGFALAYLLAAPLRRRTRMWHLALAGAVLVGVSLSWSIFVDLTPPDMRPYVGSSGSNSALSLALGYNGLSRITLAIAEKMPALRFLGQNVDLAVAPLMAPGIGNPGLLRLVNPSLAGQASWFLPLALLGLGASMSGGHTRKQRIALVVFGGWLVAWAAIFSFARFYHVYYLIMLGPGVAALTGIGLVTLWRRFRRLLGIGLLATAFLELEIVLGTASVRYWLTPLLIGGTLAALALFAVKRARPVAVALGMAALMVAPLTWSVISVQRGNGGGWLVEAGPASAAANRTFGGGGRQGFGGFGGGGGAMTFAGPNWNRLDPNLVQYLETEQGSAEYLVATQTSSYASLFILDSGQPAMALGGYQGWDATLSPSQLSQLVSDGVIRFFYVQPQRGRGGANNLDATADLVSWVTSNCAAVQVPGSAQGRAGAGLQLYDCQANPTSGVT